MFTVDLLKGQAVPLKTSTTGIGIVAAGVVVPFIVLIIIVGIFFNNRVVIPIMEHEMVVCAQKMQTLSESVKIQQNFDKEIISINASIPEAAVAVRKFTAWSPIIRTIAENMPGAMVLNKLDGKQSVKSQQGGVAREIEMSVGGTSQASWDEDVKAFRARLLESAALKARLQDITVAQQSGKGGEKDSVSYDLRMIFKDGL